MRAAVTGGAGFIGSNLVDRLVADGHPTLVVDDLSSGRAANLDRALAAGCAFTEMDVRDQAGLLDVFGAFRPDVVFHLAAQIDVRVSLADPLRDASLNVLGSINVFAAAHAAGVRRVVNTSTGGAIYGDGVPIPTPETTPTDPVSAYGLSKRTTECYAAWFRRTHGLDVVTLRYGNVYGPRQDPRGDAGVIALFVGRALAGRRPTVYGDGHQTRDYVYVGDIVAANLAAAGAARLAHDEYNVGSGTEVSVLRGGPRRGRGDGHRPRPVHARVRTGTRRRAAAELPGRRPGPARADGGVAHPARGRARGHRGMGPDPGRRISR